MIGLLITCYSLIDIPLDVVLNVKAISSESELAACCVVWPVNDSVIVPDTICSIPSDHLIHIGSSGSDCRWIHLGVWTIVNLVTCWWGHRSWSDVVVEEGINLESTFSSCALNVVKIC